MFQALAGDVAVAGGAGRLVLAGRADPLGHLGVGVQAVELVLVGGQRVEHGGVVEPLRGGEPPPVAGLLVDVGQHRVHARRTRCPASPASGSELSRRGAGVDPAGQRQQHRAGLGVAGVAPDVEQPGEGLVDAVVGHVAVGQRPRLERGEVGLREAGQVAGREPGGPVVGLALGQLGDHVVRLVPAGGVAQHRVRLRPGGQEVALHVGPERERRRVPAAVGGGAVGGQPVVGAEVVEQPVDVDEAQVVQRPRLVVEQAARRSAAPARGRRGTPRRRCRPGPAARPRRRPGARRQGGAGGGGDRGGAGGLEQPRRLRGRGGMGNLRVSAHIE